GKQKEHKLAAIGLSAVYVLGIAITYAIMGAVVARLGGSVRRYFQSAYFLVPIGVIFVGMALAMFDIITIQFNAASGLIDKVRGKSSGILGVLLVGMVSGLVAGPCLAAPLLTVLTTVAKTGSPLFGAAAMFTLAWGMGVILIVAGASSDLLPKAGMWMNWVKHLLGFIILWAAVYFTRPIIGEAAYHLGSALVILAGAVFLGGFDTLTAESGSGTRATRFGGLVALFLALWLGVLALEDMGHFKATAVAPSAEVLVEGDLESVDAALGSGKPVFLDFTADWCPNCKAVKRTTLSDAKVLAELRRFAAFKIDMTNTLDHGELVKRYDVPGPPYYLVFDSKGELLHTLSSKELLKTESFLATLKTIK
ncbi:thioredoxin family protein, partial [bacterium]|nr:thioredoxin family protein [bacterium]